MCFLSDAFHRHLCFAWRPVGRSLDRFISIRFENGHRDFGGLVWRPRRWRNAPASSEARGTPRSRWVWRQRHHRAAARFFARTHRRGPLDVAGDYFRRAPGRAVVGLLVSGSGTGRRRIHRAAHFQRERRAQRFALRPVVQPCALRAAPLALDSHRSRRGCSVSESAATRARLHAGGHSPDTARTVGNPACRIHGRLHVYGSHTAQLGQLLLDRRFLPPLSEERGKRIAFRQRFTAGDCVSGVGGCSRGMAADVRLRRLEDRTRARSRNRRRVSTPLVLVARKCVERNLRHARCDDYDTRAPFQHALERAHWPSAAL